MGGGRHGGYILLLVAQEYAALTASAAAGVDRTVAMTTITLQIPWMHV